MSKTVVVLDMDNCILLDPDTRNGSEEIKSEAWFEVFSEHPRSELESVLEQVKKEIAGGKGDRKDVVRRICEHFGTSQLEIPKEVERRCKHFNAVVQNGIHAMGISLNVRDALTRLSSRAPLYVNTGTPQQEAIESLSHLWISSLFRGVYGRPDTKVQNLQTIATQESVEPHQMLFVDDQESGWTATQEFGCRFVGIHTALNKEWHSGTPFPLIYSLAELLDMI